MDLFYRFWKSLLLVLFMLSPAASADTQIQLKGLFPGNAAVLVINGKQKVVKIGKRTPEGIRLVSVGKKTAVIEMDGARRTLSLSKSVSSSFSKPEKAVVRIQSGHGGHYFTPGRINGHQVDFLVDTGATYISLNLPIAKRLGLNYRAGREVAMSTANGMTKAYMVTLDSVRIGSVEVRKVNAVVHIGDFPQEILLGNSYLSRVNLKRERGVLVLESRL